MFSSLARTLRTVRHLRLSQILRRAGSRLKTPRLPEPPAHPPEPRADFPAVPLFKRASVAGSVGDWRLGPQTADRLGAISIHYHAWAYALAVAGQLDSLRGRLADWLDRCGFDAPGAHELAWKPYAVATRIEWWIRTGRRIGGLDERLLASLWQQAAYLHGHLEWDLRGNHLLRNAAGLAWAGRFFKGDEPRRWLETATALAVDQAREQVLPDGGHFERSPMYHLVAMEDLLAIATLTEDPEARAELRRTWSRMAEALRWMRHPDGGIPLLNDAALDGACTPAEMLAQRETGTSIMPRTRHLEDTGLAVWHTPPWVVFFDVGRIGPDYQPGHAHADTLAIECSLHGRRLFVDTGTCGYDLDERRRHDRSTAAHNTVCIDGTDSSEVWHIFRVGRRARPVDVRFDGAVASASHDGYDHLPGRPRHSRIVATGEALYVTDRIEGRGTHRLEGGYLLAPEWKAVETPGGWDLSRPGGEARVRVQGPEGLKLSVERRPYHPEFGKEIETSRITWRYQGALPVEVRITVEAP